MKRGAEVLESDLDAAKDCYLRAVEMDESLRGAWFDLGLIAKWRREWDDCLSYNRRAAAYPWVPWEGAEDTSDPAYWNAGIAATALSDWDAARWSWRGYGIEFPDGHGPIETDFGPGVVRLDPGETVWGTRIDPARMRLLSVPFPETGFRRGDIVLHDGEPVGRRVSDGYEYPVFDAIERWHANDVPTTVVDVTGDDASVEALEHELASEGVTVENWSTSIVFQCLACSMGRIDYDAPDHDHPPNWRPGGAIRLGCSGAPDRIRAAADRWSSVTGMSVIALTTHD